MNDIIFKTILLKGEAGNNIGTIAKTSTEGVVDTYTITLTDGSTSTFQVTNGSNISSIEKTATSGYIDTYTITLTNGDTFNFSVTNGQNGSERNLAPWEDGNTATRTYYKGDHVVWLGNYYRTIKNIAKGDAFVVDDNIESAFVGEEIGALEIKTASLESNLTANNKSFKFDYDSTKQKYGYTVDGVFYPFRKGAILVGTYSADTTIDVSDLGAESANQFLAVCDTSSNVSNEWGNGQEGSYGMGWVHASANYTAPTKSLSGNTLTLTVGKYYYQASAPSGGGNRTTNLSTKLYYVGDIESLT